MVTSGKLRSGGKKEARRDKEEITLCGAATANSIKYGAKGKGRPWEACNDDAELLIRWSSPIYHSAYEILVTRVSRLAHPEKRLHSSAASAPISTSSFACTFTFISTVHPSPHVHLGPR